jgi:hypothetical protein
MLMRLKWPVWIAGRFLMALAEAVLKCAVAFAIAFVAVYPLVAMGQGEEAMMAIFNADPWNVSWFVVPSVLAYTCTLTFFFLYFLLARWNFRAKQAHRSFIRIWLPGLLALCIGLTYPIAAELSPQQSRIWDAGIGLTNVGVVLGCVVAVWWWTKPPISRPIVYLCAGASIALFAAFVFAPLLVFYALAIVVLTAFCVLARREFRDRNLDPEAAQRSLSMGLSAALLVAILALVLSSAAVPLRMLVGAPSLVLVGFSFLLAIAYALAALLRNVSPVLVRLAWLGVAALVVVSPIGREPLRVLDHDPLPSRRPSPSEHFAAWLQTRSAAVATKDPYPVFFVAAQGGGIRAAYWTATLLAALEERYPGFTDHVYAISGVSGGSVGAAVFAAMHRELPERGAQGCAPLVDGGVHGLRPCVAYVLEWDLLGPPLGALLFNDIPFGWHERRRATDLEQGLEYAWFASTEGRQFDQPLQALWHDDPYRVPSLILNTTSARDGRRVVVSNLFAQGELTVEPDVEAQLGHPVRLSTAAFLSARFPLISPEATFDLTEAGKPRAVRLVDGGYFNNAGTASIASLLRVVLPKAGARIRPIVLVLASDVDEPDAEPGLFDASLASAIVEPVGVLAQTGSAHEATYLREIRELMRRDDALFHLRPPAGSKKVALGWLLSDATRCEMDGMVNDIVNESAASKAVAQALRAVDPPKLRWRSCGDP